MAFCAVGCTEEPQRQQPYRNLTAEEEASLLGTQPQENEPPAYNYSEFAIDKPRLAARAPAAEVEAFNREMKGIEQERRIEMLELEAKR